MDRNRYQTNEDGTRNQRIPGRSEYFDSASLSPHLKSTILAVAERRDRTELCSGH